MNRAINLKEMPATFSLCNVKECPLAETCLRQVVYPAVSKKGEPFLSTLNPEWLAKQKGTCRFYLQDEPVIRARGFKRLLDLLPAGKVASFRASAISAMGYRRYYRTRKGEILLTEAEEKMIVRLANRYGVVTDDYFDGHEQVLLWSHESVPED